MEIGNPYGSDKSHPIRIHRPSRPSKIVLQTSETPTTVNHRNQNCSSHNDSYRPMNQWSNDQYPWKKSHQIPMSKVNRIQPMITRNISTSDSSKDQTKNLTKPEIKEINEKRFHPIILKKQFEENRSGPSPTSWSMRSEQHPQLKASHHLHVHLSQSSSSPTSSEEFLDQSSTTPRTYRLIESHVQSTIPTKKYLDFNQLLFNRKNKRKSLFSVSISPLNDPPSVISSRHTEPFVCSPKEDQQEIQSNDHSLDQMENPKDNPSNYDLYTLSDQESTEETLDRDDRSPSPLQYIPLTKKLQFSSVQPSLSVEKDDQRDSDDGWSEDSADILYVDERYRIERQKIKSSSSSSSHLTTQQQHYPYQIRQQNVLLQ